MLLGGSFIVAHHMNLRLVPNQCQQSLPKLYVTMQHDSCPIQHHTALDTGQLPYQRPSTRTTPHEPSELDV